MTSPLTDLDALCDALLVEETRVWEALVRGDANADHAALDAQFIGVYPDGVFGRDAHADQLKDGPSVACFQLRDVRAMALGPEYGLLTYHATYQRAGRTEPEQMYVSSVWRKNGQGWINVFSQDTPATPVRP